MASFEAQIAAYAESLNAFRAEHILPDEWFANPDHVAIKCADAADYEATIERWLPRASSAQYVKLDGRRLASAWLRSPLTLKGAGQVEWLEIMEPRPEKVGKDTVGIDHVEFKFVDFDAAAAFLDSKGIAYEQQENPGHQWLSIMAGGYEFKLTNKTLAEVVANESAAGVVIRLKG